MRYVEWLYVILSLNKKKIKCLLNIWGCTSRKMVFLLGINDNIIIPHLYYSGEYQDEEEKERSTNW